MPVLAKPDTIAGPLTAADLPEAHAHSTGSIWRSPHRLPAGCDQQGRHDTRDWQQWHDTVPTQPAECCTELGHDDDPYDGNRFFRGLISAIGITALLAAAVLVLA